MTRSIHLDVIGGLAGDMFAAAVVDAQPALALELLATLRLISIPAAMSSRFDECCAGGLKGLRFVVPSAHADAHEHRHYKDLRGWIEQSSLTVGVKQHALGLFQVLAEAEAAVHGIAVEQVEFHEVGASDSICDFVAAAAILDKLGTAGWSWSPLPLGSGRVRCAHGVLPVPAPATARLLAGMRVIDDGVSGERITPTGAAILQYLVRCGSPGTPPARVERVLSANGIGHGTRTLQGVPNIVRCLVFEEARQTVMQTGDIAALQFEVDDQSPEDLAVGIEHLRQLPGVLEIYQAPVYAKKGRIAVQLQVLLEAWSVDSVVEACFVETTTLGVRMASVHRRTLDRSVMQLPGAVRVKLANRPGRNVTAKAEMDDFAETRGHEVRRRERAMAEAAALRKGST